MDWFFYVVVVIDSEGMYWFFYIGYLIILEFRLRGIVIDVFGYIFVCDLKIDIV